MLRKQSFAAAASGLFLVGSFGLLSCEGGAQRGEQVGQQEQQQQEQQQQQPREGVIAEEVEPMRGMEATGTEVREGEEQLKARKRILERQIVEYDIPTIQMCEEKPDLNEMSAEHMAALGVEQQAAQRIVQYREQQGKFSDVSELQKVPGLDQNTIQQLQNEVAVKPQQR